MLDLRRSFQTVLAATVLSSALAVWAGMGPAAAAVTPEPTGRAPRAADAPSKPVTKSKPVTRKPTAKPTAKQRTTQRHAAAPQTRKLQTTPKMPKVRKARALDTFGYRLQVSAGRGRAYAMASGRIEITDTGASNKGMIGDWGAGSAAVSFTPIKDDGTNLVKKEFSAADERKATDWTDDNKIKSVKIQLCKVIDPQDPNKSVCRTLDVPRA